MIRDLPANMQTKVRVEGDCWVWTAAKTSKGYGSVACGGSRIMSAHRRAYSFVKGEIPEGLTIDHLCRNKLCVNPDHLEPVTNAENARRRGAAQTHCKRGHEYTEASTFYHSKSGNRGCRICRYDLWVQSLGRPVKPMGRPPKNGGAPS